MGLFRKPKQPELRVDGRGNPIPPGDREPIRTDHRRVIEQLRIWDGPWRLSGHDMTWRRPEAYYFHTNYGHYPNYLSRNEQLHAGPMVRPGPLRDVVELYVPHAILRSHPDTPGVLPERLEGMWIDTNPAWPESSTNRRMGGLGLQAAWDDSMPPQVERFELKPALVDPVTTEGYEPFGDIPPVLVEGVVVYVRPVDREVPTVAVA